MKYKCYKCKLIAVWYYMPCSDNYNENERYFCDNCIIRGCSCNFNYETNEEDKDELNRLLPCVEYNYNENGYEMENK